MWQSAKLCKIVQSATVSCTDAIKTAWTTGWCLKLAQFVTAHHAWCMDMAELHWNICIYSIYIYVYIYYIYTYILYTYILYVYTICIYYIYIYWWLGFPRMDCELPPPENCRGSTKHCKFPCKIVIFQHLWTTFFRIVFFRFGFPHCNECSM